MALFWLGCLVAIWTAAGADAVAEEEGLKHDPVLNAPVLDKTNLRRSYNFSLEFIDPRLPQLADDDPRPNPFKVRPDPFTAVEEQLGLQLQAAKGPVEVLVIDAIERPSPN